MNIKKAKIVRNPQKYHFCATCSADNAKKPVLVITCDCKPINKTEYRFHICILCARGMSNVYVVSALNNFDKQKSLEEKDEREKVAAIR